MTKGTDHIDKGRDELSPVKRKPVASPSRSRKSWHVTPNTFLASTVLGAALLSWPLRWIVSGAPLLVYTILLGASKEYRILPYIPLWTLFTTLNLVYAVAATSWLLYWVFAAFCYPTILLACLFQFDAAAKRARWAFRTLLRDLHFINDKIAFFNLPALEIDTDVDGLLVVRGFTFSLSSLTVVAHGIEVGIKLSDDMELAIQTEKVTISLLRKIEIDDVYANVKGGEFEMTFGTLQKDTHDKDGDAIMVTNTPLLRAASAALDGTMPSRQKMKAAMVDGAILEDSSDPAEIIGSIQRLSPDDEKASTTYKDVLRRITDTCTANIARKTLEDISVAGQVDAASNLNNANDMRAAICASIHDQATIPHPPSRSVRVSTLQNSSSPAVKKFMHRLPLLLRLLLYPLSYFHPITIKSLTIAGSGKWMVHLMKHYLFKHYSSQDAEVRRIEDRIDAWMSDANFAVELGPMYCMASVPINTEHDIECHLKIEDFMAYRTITESVTLSQVIRLGGADATVSIPSYLLPHHEHILPKKPTQEDEMEQEQAVADAEGTPNTVLAERALEQLVKDESNITISAHAHLPACFDQELLNFTAALVKATKVIEMERDFEEHDSLREIRRSESNASNSSLGIASGNEDSQKAGFKDFMRKMDRGMKEIPGNFQHGMRKAGHNTVNAMANDRWIAKLVGKVMRKLENAQGDVGYSGNIPIALDFYRKKAEPESKLLP
ncbi:hypothetical protein BU16DRAFT_38121 [Lophium mytilinum]|uniref:Uncharacterized protein n=1 Tax=Lophium mytilinum TaxID=390894 RepID=A0A6A6RIP3_9PEZI|nr:hypothetical protein BU16DRAFT_38121 [Lophium mytilinum]